MPNNNTPERPLVTERLAALDSNGNDCRLARYVLYLEGEVTRLREIERLAKEFFAKTKQYKTTFMDAPIVFDHVNQKEAIQKWVGKTEEANNAKTEAEYNLYEAIFATVDGEDE